MFLELCNHSLGSGAVQNRTARALSRTSFDTSGFPRGKAAKARQRFFQRLQLAGTLIAVAARITVAGAPLVARAPSLARSSLRDPRLFRALLLFTPPFMQGSAIPQPASTA